MFLILLIVLFILTIPAVLLLMLDIAEDDDGSNDTWDSPTRVRHGRIEWREK